MQGTDRTYDPSGTTTWKEHNRERDEALHEKQTVVEAPLGSYLDRTDPSKPATWRIEDSSAVDDFLDIDILDGLIQLYANRSVTWWSPARARAIAAQLNAAADRVEAQ